MLAHLKTGVVRGIKSIEPAASPRPRLTRLVPSSLL